MRIRCSVRTRLLISVLTIMLTACAGYSGSNLRPGASTLGDIVASMGEPAMRWKDADGREQLAYPRGPAAPQTFMVYVAADGTLERIEGVLDDVHFARIRPGSSDQAEVLRLLGPSPPQWTAYFSARDELVWEWRVCDTWNQVSRFDVLFDGSSGLVRTTYYRPDPDFGLRGNTQSCVNWATLGAVRAALVQNAASRALASASRLVSTSRKDW